MGRLAEAGLVDLTWTEDEDGNLFAEGLQSYEIDGKNELAIFNGPKCVDVRECADLSAAIAVVFALEAVCRWNIQMGCDWRGHKVDERGRPL